MPFKTAPDGAEKTPPAFQLTRVRHNREALEVLAAAGALAEAGDDEGAARLLDEFKRGRKILVATRGGGFPRGLCDYALGLAERMGDALVFLAVGPARFHTAPGAEDLRAFMREQFEQLVCDSLEEVRRKADQMGVAHQTVIRFGDLAEALTEASGDFGRIDCILTGKDDVEPVRRAAVVAVFSA